MSKLRESLKYLTAMFQIKTNYFKYLRAVFLYKIKRKVKFPESKLILKGAKFLTRKDSMDIAHLSNLYEKDTTNLFLSLNPKTFVDVGTHIGRYSIVLASKGSRVVSIEPSKENFKQLNKNIKLNNLQDKIKALNFGCSYKNGKETLYFVMHNEGLSSIEKKEEAKKEVIYVKKLDDICRDINLDPKEIDLIKADVEGFELNVLKGSTNILSRGSPMVIVEINGREKEKPIKDFLKKFDYKNKCILDERNFIFVKVGR